MQRRCEILVVASIVVVSAGCGAKTELDQCGTEQVRECGSDVGVCEVGGSILVAWEE